MSFRGQSFRLRMAVVGALLLLAAPCSGRAEDLYFVTVYGAQRPVINLPRYTHTWATLTRLNGCGRDLRKYRAGEFTISWLSADLTVDPKNLRPQPGRNLTLQETLAWCDDNRMQVAQFGPYQTDAELYNLMFQRWARLERGDMKYRASDLLNGKADEVCNCIYAVLDYDGRDPAIRPVTLGFGWKASAFVARRLEEHMVEPGRTHPFVSEMIGVKNFENPPFGPITRLLNPGPR